MYRIYFLLPIFSLTLISCSRSKQYDSCDDIASSLQDEHYSDLVEEWGEPYKKEYYGPNDEWLCKWHGVGVGSTDAEVHFTDILYSWGAHGPFVVRGTDCEPDKYKSDVPASPIAQMHEGANRIIIKMLEDLPDPRAVINTGNSYLVKGFTKEQIYQYYKIRYQAQLHDSTLNFYVNIDESDFVSQSSLRDTKDGTVLVFEKVDTSSLQQ